MDGYKKALGRLSCVPMADIEKLADGSVFRCAFVVETVQVKVSSKSQKKFAILVISDGMERFELPVWSEMFEEKAHLLRENQLLYGVLQQERKEGKVQLSCRYLDDLTTVDEAKIKICDDAYDKFKMLAAKAEGKWKNKEKTPSEKPAKETKEKEVVREEPPINLKLFVDADRARLSEIVALKDLFRSHPGQSTIELHFKAGQKKLGSVLVEAAWGVKADKGFLDKLKGILTDSITIA
jgi:DNA polymerase-3 subunit alpha